MPAKVPTFRPPRIAPYKPAGPSAAEQSYRKLLARLEDNRFYASTPWRKLRAAFLAEFPLCQECHEQGITEVARHVHHVKERRTHPDLSLDWDNLQALCVPCHGMKRSVHE